MKRRGFLRLLSGGAAAAFRALGLVTPASPDYLGQFNRTLVLTKSQRKAYQNVDLGGWTLTILPEAEVYDARGGDLIPIDLKRIPI